MKVYVVCWANASLNDNGDCSAHSGVHGVYSDRKKAKEGLVACKDECYDEIVYNPDYDEDDIEELKASTKVYGSVEQEYFEIDYASSDVPNEIYIQIVESEVK